MARPTLYRHPKFVNLQILLDTIAPHALGYLTMVWEAGWESGNPVVGSASVVERLAHWPGEPGKLCNALVSAGGEDGVPGFLEEVSGRPGIYQIHDFWDHAPEYVKDRKRKEDTRKGRNRVAVSSSCPDFVREKSGNVRDKVGQTPEMSENVQDLSGESPTLSGFCPKKSDTPTPTPTPTPAQNTNTSSALAEESGNAKPGNASRIAQDATEAKPVQGFVNDTPEGLAALFRMAKAGPPNSQETLEACVEHMRQSLASGVSPSIIRAEIDSRNRNRSEPIWTLIKRVSAAKAKDAEPEPFDRARFIRERDERFERLKRESDARREENRIADEAFRKIYGVEKSIMNMVAVKAGTLKPLAEKEVEVKSA